MTADLQTKTRREPPRWRGPTCPPRCSLSTADDHPLRARRQDVYPRHQYPCSVDSLSPLFLCSVGSLLPRWRPCAAPRPSRVLAGSQRPSGDSHPLPSLCTGDKPRPQSRCSAGTLSPRFLSLDVTLRHLCLSSGATLPRTSPVDASAPPPPI